LIIRNEKLGYYLGRKIDNQSASTVDAGLETSIEKERGGSDGQPSEKCAKRTREKSRNTCTTETWTKEHLPLTRQIAWTLSGQS